jgi:hypothetical protein
MATFSESQGWPLYTGLTVFFLLHYNQLSKLGRLGYVINVETIIITFQSFHLG